MKCRGVQCLLGEPWASLYRLSWTRVQGTTTLAIRVFILCALLDQNDLKSMEGYFAWLPRMRGRKTLEGGGHQAKHGVDRPQGGVGQPHLFSSTALVPLGVFYTLPESSRDVFHRGLVSW